ncbi:endoribonuclease L-PSP, putative [Bodo saltans]|uniref:Endoribonuclease L-PSP, putative n=1 Tax=Bodo saltans TaxID=75058 RepID=A0A0S4JNW3_BODSA|nr:endoribonuclease L-PSP, putative [Bodo saltans]|eukprot:CUG91930.1 endoribonuclease L-PSP, putative [Bodo saltans]
MSAGRVVAKLSELGVVLPTPAAPAANYIPFSKSGNQIHVAGQLPKIDDKLVLGKLGGNLTIDEGKAAAKACIISFLAQLNAATGGNLDKIKKIVKINVFVNSTPDFVDQPQVANGASDFLVLALGDAGRHARSAVGVASLPFGVAVEIDGIVEIDETSSNL